MKFLNGLRKSGKVFYWFATRASYLAALDVHMDMWPERKIKESDCASMGWTESLEV